MTAIRVALPGAPGVQRAVSARVSARATAAPTGGGARFGANMSDQPTGDSRDRLADLERKLRELESELLHGVSSSVPSAAPADAPGGPAAEAPRAEPQAVAPPPQAAAPPEAAEPPAIDDEVERPSPDLLLARAHEQIAALRETIEGLVGTTDRLRAVARTVVEDHGRALVRLERAAAAAEDRAAEAEAREAAVPAQGPGAEPAFEGGITVKAGPFADPASVSSFRRSLAEISGAREVYLRGYEGGRAVLEVELETSPGEPPGP